jgi:general secretion pathway protein A
VGTGKTTLLRAALDQIPADTEVALLMNTAELTPTDLLRLIAAEFQLPGPFHSKVDYIIALNRFLLEQLERGLNTVLIIDEAQNLDATLLEEVRLLSNLETDTEKLLQIVLTGQPELKAKLATRELRQLRQRIAIEHHVKPLGPDEVKPFLAHRIRVAGGDYDEVFASGVERVFYAFSGGTPRLLCLLADRSLLAAFARQIRPVPLDLVEAKAKEMDEVRGSHLLGDDGG